MSTKETGTVKFYNEAKGYGFIKHDGSENETFLHATGLFDKVKQDYSVEFAFPEGNKGMNAVNVWLL